MGRPSKKESYVAPEVSERAAVKTEDEDERFNSALARGLALLRAFTREDRFLTNAELAERTGIPKPTVTRLAFTLAKLGYLQFDDRLQQYELAAGVVALGYPYMARQIVPAVARPLMMRLAEQSGASVGLGVREGLSVFYLEAIDGDPHPQLPYRAGVRIPMAHTAMGRACYLSLGSRQRQDLEARLREAYPADWQRIQGEFVEGIEFYRQHGYVMRSGGFHPASQAVAVPFVSSTSDAVMAFSARAPADARPERMAELGQLLNGLVQAVNLQIAANPASRGSRP